MILILVLVLALDLVLDWSWTWSWCEPAVCPSCHPCCCYCRPLPPPPVLLPAQALASLLCVSQGALYCLIIVAPLAAFQYQGYLTFCR